MSDPPLEELVIQLQQDLKEGESLHIEFKDYDLDKLAAADLADKWKADLAHELAALASIGGRIYIGVTDDGKIVGVKGLYKDWDETLFQRSLGNIQPTPVRHVYWFKDPNSLVNVIRIEVTRGEPIYYCGGKPYIRDCTVSRPAQPDEVKEKFKEYFAYSTSRYDILSLHEDSQDQEKKEVLGWMLGIVLNIMIYLDHHESKQVNPQLDELRYQLQDVSRTIEDNLDEVKTIFGTGSEYYKKLDLLSVTIQAATNIQFMMDGGASWRKWLEHLDIVQKLATDLFERFKREDTQIQGLEEHKAAVIDKLSRWLDTIDMLKLNKFVYEAPVHSRSFLRVYFLHLLNATGNGNVEKLKNLAQQLEKLSWAKTNVDYQKIVSTLPSLKKELQELN